MAGIRTPNRQFSSCTLIEIGDSLDSIFYGNVAIGQYVAKRAGIGINAGSIRALGSKVRNGEVVIETNYETSHFKIDSYENIYDVHISFIS